MRGEEGELRDRGKESLFGRGFALGRGREWGGMRLGLVGLMLEILMVIVGVVIMIYEVVIVELPVKTNQHRTRFQAKKRQLTRIPST